jgi:hypothetical protein
MRDTSKMTFSEPRKPLNQANLRQIGTETERHALNSRKHAPFGSLIGGIFYMHRHTLPIALAALAAVVAAPAQALAAPTMTDQVMIWQVYQLEPDTANRNDAFIYYTKQFWITPECGISTFYNTSQSATVRGLYKADLAGLTTTWQAGIRYTGLGNAAVTPTGLNAAMKMGPEVALTVAKSLGGGFSISALGSYARLVGPNSGGAVPTNLTFYGANLNQKVAPSTTLSVGVLGAYSINAEAAKPSYHNLGPSLSLTQSF